MAHHMHHVMDAMGDMPMPMPPALPVCNCTMPMPGSGGSGGMDMGGGMGMGMELHFSTAETGVLFAGWNFSGGSYAGFCIALIFTCMFKEALFAWRTHRLGKTFPTNSLLDSVDKTESGGKPYASVQSSRRAAMTLTTRALASFFYVVNLFFGYMIMLVLMTYNWGFIFAILFGSAIGHFVFNWLLAPTASAPAEVEAECCEK